MKAKQTFISLISLGMTAVLILSSCVRPKIYGDDEFTYKFAPVSYGEGSEPRIPQFISVYQYRNSELHSSVIFTPDKDGTAKIYARKGDHIYFLSGKQPDNPAQDEAGFAATSFGTTEDGVLADFLYGQSVIPEIRYDIMTANLSHSTARIDLKVENPSQMRITKVTVEDAPAEIVPFSLDGYAAETKTTSLSYTAGDDFTGEVEGMFRIYSGSTVHFTIEGSQNGTPTSMRVTIPSVEGGKIYEILVLGSGADVRGDFRLRSWEDGNTVIAKPDTYGRILLDDSESSIPENVEMKAGDNMVFVPNSGAQDMTLAVVADAPVEISTIEGSSRGATIGSMYSTLKNGRYVSSFKASIPAQGNGRLGYAIRVNLRYTLVDKSYDCIKIMVAPSDRLIDTVRIAGRTWMAFNGVSADLNEQIYLIDGMSGAEDMYMNKYATSIGYLFQFGRMTKYVPWQGYSQFQGDRDTPWRTDGKMPCPEGYRLPTRDELNTLLPKGKTVPGSWSAGGDEITATIETSKVDLKAETGRGGTPLIIKLSSKNSGQSMYLPLAGEKGDKNRTNDPGFGKSLVLWADVLSNTGGYAWAHKISYNAENNTASFSDNHREAESFAYVRCIKK